MPIAVLKRENRELKKRNIHYTLNGNGDVIGYILRSPETPQPQSIRLCTFLDKQLRRIVRVPIAYRGFKIPDRFVVGYGLDYRQLYRNLPYTGVLSDEVTGLNPG
jgi:hypoxanthine phosphoribosyltransferase